MKFVIGIPTVTRNPPYLVRTLRSLIESISPSHRERVRIVIFDADAESNNPALLEIKRRWPDFFQSEFLSVFRRESPLPREGNGCSLKQRWQRKQVLDCAELFRFCAGLGEYYLHVEDDVVSSSDFLESIENCLSAHRSRGTSWSMLSLYNSYRMTTDEYYTGSQLSNRYFGLIGQLVRCKDLIDLAEYVSEHCGELPVDVLVGRFWLSRGGRVYGHSPALFQHIGVISSLIGRTQMWTAPDFHECLISRVRRGLLGCYEVITHQPRSLGAYFVMKAGFGVGPERRSL